MKKKTTKKAPSSARVKLPTIKSGVKGGTLPFGYRPSYLKKLLAT